MPGSGASGRRRRDADRLREAGRRARLVEVDPGYCDVVVRRWQEHTGEAAVLENNGRSFNEVAAGRQSATVAGYDVR